MFIVFEGPDGSGKSTQIRLLEKYFKSQGKKVFIRREPGGSYWGEKIRDIILKNERSSELGFDSQLYLALLSYAEGLKETAKYLEAGYIVISDRLSEFSSHIYQGQLGNPESPLNYEAIEEYHRKAREFCNGPVPDKVICILPPLEETKKRASQKQRDYLDKIDEGFISRYNGYSKLFDRLESKDPYKLIIIKDVDTPENILEIIKSKLV